MLTSSAATENFVLDVNTLESLKRRARESNGANQEVASQFEALFVQMMLKSMRDATPKDGLFDSSQTRMLQSVLDEQLSQHLAKPGIGLAQALLAQMRRRQDQLPDLALAAGQAGDANATDVAAFRPLEQVASLFNRGRDADARVRPGPVGALLDILRTGPLESARALASRGHAPDHAADFVARLAAPARAVAKASGLPLRLILGQAALESGWGQREITLPDGATSHNVFGIKATGGWQGRVAEVMTTEYTDGVPRKTVQAFRAYRSYEHALADYASLITGSARYRQVLAARDENHAAREIQAAGYATDPAYADKLIQVMAQLPL